MLAFKRWRRCQCLQVVAEPRACAHASLPVTSIVVSRCATETSSLSSQRHPSKTEHHLCIRVGCAVMHVMSSNNKRLCRVETTMKWCKGAWYHMHPDKGTWMRVFTRSVCVQRNDSCGQVGPCVHAIAIADTQQGHQKLGRPPNTRGEKDSLVAAVPATPMLEC